MVRSSVELNNMIYDTIVQRTKKKMEDNNLDSAITPLMDTELQSAAKDLTQALWPEFESLLYEMAELEEHIAIQESD